MTNGSSTRHPRWVCPWRRRRSARKARDGDTATATRLPRQLTHDPTLWGGLALGLNQSIGSVIIGSAYRDFVIYAAFLVVLLLKPTLQRVTSGIQGLHAERLMQKAAK